MKKSNNDWRTDEMSKIGVIDADLMDNGTRHPNLALMKIAGYYKELGNEVELVFIDYKDVLNYDRLFMSKVFNFTKVPAWVLELPNIEIGGTGFFEDNAPNLPDEIEHHMPDYHLYDKWVEAQIAEGKQEQHYIDYINFSIGFTTRGCFRKCSFCVNKKYDHVFRSSPVSEFLDETRPAIYLWDDNILGFPGWEDVIDELDATGKPYQFRQGVDLRLMTDRKAMRLNNAKWYGDFIFAFDHIEDRELICEKVQLWKRYSSKVCKMYVLSGYDSQDVNDLKNVLERIKLLMYYGSLPYIMRYQDYVNSEFKGMYIQLARWCNQPSFFKKKSFRQYCEANQEYQYHGKMDKNCASYQAMIDFEKKYPEVAAEYFDLRFEQENMYEQQYGYGRKYANKTSCKECRKKYITWEQFVSVDIEDDMILKWYFTKEADLLCTCYRNSECLNTAAYAHKLVESIINKNLQDIANLINDSDSKEVNDEVLCAANIFEVFGFLMKIIEKQEDKSYQLKELKKNLFEGCDKNGIEHSNNVEVYLKLAAQCDLIRFSMNRSNSLVKVTPIGEEYTRSSEKKQRKLFKRLLLRYPLIQYYWTDREKYEQLLNTLTNKNRKLMNDLIEFIS